MSVRLASFECSRKFIIIITEICLLVLLLVVDKDHSCWFDFWIRCNLLPDFVFNAHLDDFLRRMG